MKKILTLVLCMSVGISVLAQKEDIKAIKNVYATYNKATANRDAEESIRCLTTSSVEYYSKLLTLCKTADSALLASLPAMDIFMTLTIKARTDASLLCAMNSGEELLRHALQEGMTGDTKSLDEITINGDSAYAIIKGSVVSVLFIKEPAGWKLDLTQSLSLIGQRIEASAQIYKIPKQELCLAVLKQSALEIPETIWEPACKE